MSWKINYSNQALDDLKSIYEYIAYQLFAPDTAKNQVGRITKSIKALGNMPKMYKIYQVEPWKSKKLRIFSVDNYIVLYLPKEDFNTVNVVRIIYGGRDIERQLDETPPILP